MSRVALWAEAGPAIGLGHFMRCRTLAQALLARGHSPVFVLDDASAAAVGGMIPEGAARLRVDQGARFAAGHPAPDAMILDLCHHGRTDLTDLIARLKARLTGPLAVIDSMPPLNVAPRPDAAPDLVITPYHAADALTPAPACARWLVGARYAILDPAYAAARARARPLPRRLLLSMGGADPSGLGLRVLDRLTAAGTAGAGVDVVIGALFPNALKTALTDRAASSGGRIALVPQPRGLTDAILNAGLVICRAGLIRYEAACLGRDTWQVIDLPGHEAYFSAFEGAGFGKVFHLPQDGARLDAAVAGLAAGPGPRFNRAAFAAVDGMGADRVLDALGL